MNFSILHDSTVNDICIAIIAKKLNFLAKLMKDMKRMELEKICVAVFTENADGGRVLKSKIRISHYRKSTDNTYN